MPKLLSIGGTALLCEALVGSMYSLATASFANALRAVRIGKADALKTRCAPRKGDFIARTGTAFVLLRESFPWVGDGMLVGVVFRCVWVRLFWGGVALLLLDLCVASVGLGFACSTIRS